MIRNKGVIGKSITHAKGLNKKIDVCISKIAMKENITNR